MQLFLIVLLSIAVAGMAAAFVGTRLPKTHMAASRIRLKAPPEQVFEIIADFEGYPSWRPGLGQVERGPDIEGLPSWFEICAKVSRVHFRVAEWNAPSRLVTRIVDDKLPMTGCWTYQLEPDGEGTLLTITEEENIHHPLLRFFDRFVLSYHGVMDVYLTALARKLGDPAVPEHLSLRLGDGEAAS